jgi:hypothetical protein
MVHEYKNLAFIYMPRKTQKRRGGKGLNPSKLQGGMSTSEWGVKTFGEMGQQHAIPGSNILQVNAGVGGQPQPQAGGSALMATVLNPEVLTPVVLTLASNVVGKKMGKSRKMRGGNVMVPAMLVLANHTIPKLLKKGKKVKGGTVRKVPMMGGGENVINDSVFDIQGRPLPQNINSLNSLKKADLTENQLLTYISNPKNAPKIKVIKILFSVTNITDFMQSFKYRFLSEQNTTKPSEQNTIDLFVYIFVDDPIFKEFSEDEQSEFYVNKLNQAHQISKELSNKVNNLKMEMYT